MDVKPFFLVTRWVNKPFSLNMTATDDKVSVFTVMLP